MIQSMTGYGNAEGRLEAVAYLVEIRSLNNRYFRTKIKLPEPIGFLEEDVDNILRKELSRGTINYTLHLRDAKPDVLFHIDHKALEKYLEQLSLISSRSNANTTIDIGSLLILPGIIQPISPDEETAGKIRDEVLKATRHAIDKLKQMRTTEGVSLQTDLETHCEQIKYYLDQIDLRRTAVVKSYHEKLKKRVEELLANVEIAIDEQLLARELAIFAEKSDISEEIDRLQSHLKQFAQCCKSDQQVGRKLDFIAQEMLREANTIASKAADVETINCVVEIKCRIDRVKEQVQNIE